MLKRTYFTTFLAVLVVLLCLNNHANAQNTCVNEVKRTKLCESNHSSLCKSNAFTKNRELEGALLKDLYSEKIDNIIMREKEYGKNAQEIKQDPTTNKSYFEEFQNNFSNELGKTQVYDGHNDLVSLLHKTPSVSFYDKQLIDENKTIVLYDSSKKDDVVVRPTIVDISNTFFEDNVMYNLASSGVRGGAPISMVNILGLLKTRKDPNVIRSVNEFFGTERYDFYNYITTIFNNSALKVNGVVSINTSEVVIPNITFASIGELNAKFRQDFQVLNDVFKDESIAQGYASVDANFDFENEFSRLESMYDFTNSDGSVSTCYYIQGVVNGMLSTDKSTLRFFIAKDVYVDLTKDFSDFGHRDFVDKPVTFGIVFPEFELKSIVRLKNIVYDGRFHTFRGLEKLGNFYFVSDFHSNAKGFFLGEKPNDPEAKATQTELVPSVIVNSAFKMKLYYKNILIFEGIIDGGKSIKI